MQQAKSSFQTVTLSQPAQPLTVLVVDDSRLQRKVLGKFLEAWGFRVLSAASGEAALGLCQHPFPDIVISDWMMPGMSGLEFCSALRKEMQGDYCYFILLTSKSEKSDVAEGLDTGADDFLTKPVNPNELRARIRAGERILQMQQELSEKNRLIAETVAELQHAQDLIHRDLLEAQKLQQSLLPERYRVFDRGELSLVLRSSGPVGGDLVGYFPVGSDHLVIFAIDVSGHGISSALMTARLSGYLSATSPDQNIALLQMPDGRYRPRQPAEAIELLNDLVLDEMETEHYFTFLLAVVDLRSGHLCIGQAGHPHPILQCANGDLHHLGGGGFPVGLMSAVDFHQFEVELSAGDRLFILSDGVSECVDPQGTQLGEAGLNKFLARHSESDVDAVLDHLMSDLVSYAGGDEFEDDVSGIVFQYGSRPDR